MTARSDVTSSNWLDAPFNRIGMLRVPELARTERISRGSGPVFELARRERSFDSFRFEHARASLSLREMLDASYTDAFLILHEGAIAFEHYAPGVQPADTHLLMSVSKSLASTLCGVLVGRGLLRTSDAVVDRIEDLRGTSWEGCTVQHLLDMRTGTRWSYKQDEIAILDVSAYRTHSRADVPPDTESWIRSIDNSHEHGREFRYISLVSDVLGWVLERAAAARFAELFAREIWSALGAEGDAQIIVDASGFSIVEGGICATLRDLGRFGLMCLQHGALAGRQLVPESWLGRLRARDPELVGAFAASVEFDPAKPDAFYHDNWWIYDAARGIYAGLGINGQTLLVHHPTQTVMVKFSSHPAFEDRALFALQDAGMLALCDWLGRARG
ncbi:MAG TPA: serine hydrolase [Myxococcota bacterium]|nr:serine hydrolase [Myxococcota bacterium]